MLEQDVVDMIVSDLAAHNRYVINTHGSKFSHNGVPDLTTTNKLNQLVGIEVKAPGKTPYVNQWRQAIEMIKSGCMYFIGQDDFDVDAMDNHEIPILYIPDDEFECINIKVKNSVEVKLKA